MVDAMDKEQEAFSRFGELPPEVQITVWQHALATCYCIKAPINGKFHQQRLDLRAWMGLLFACKVANEVARKDESLATRESFLRGMEREHGEGGAEYWVEVIEPQLSRTQVWPS